MPIISRFFGIVIAMYWRDHRPPHFHAKYAGEEITMEIETGAINGIMSKRAIGLVEEWRKIHQEELINNWKLLEEHKALKPIQPLE